MPRLSPSILLQAHALSPLLPLVLRGCRTLPSAINELRWLREHVRETYPTADTTKKAQKLLSLCRRRENAEPLQYILGSQPFGELDLACERGVLIPRPETEAYTTYLSNLLLRGLTRPSLSSDLCQRGGKQHWRVLDACSGSGCISLLLYSRLWRAFPGLSIFGIDVSETAIALSEKNLKRNRSLLGPITDEQGLPAVRFEQVSLFDHKSKEIGGFENFDIIISNPPYISQFGFNNETSRSVRNWEPRLALVPESGEKLARVVPEDIFYQKLLEIFLIHHPKILLMEIGDEDQAIRVINLAIQSDSSLRLEIWRDWPNQKPEANEPREMEIEGKTIAYRGSGKARAVIAFASDLEMPT